LVRGISRYIYTNINHDELIVFRYVVSTLYGFTPLTTEVIFSRHTVT